MQTLSKPFVLRSNRSKGKFAFSINLNKTAYALLCGAGGVMVFRVGCDKLPSDPNNVARGIQNTMVRLANDW